MSIDVAALRALLERPILNLHGGTSCARCAGSLKGGPAPLCACPMDGDAA